MKSFLTLFKYERQALFPSIKLKRRPDILGGLLSLIVSLLVVAVFLLLVSAVAESYVLIKIDKVSDPTARSLELMNALYTIIIVGLAFMCLEKMRTTLVSNTGKKIFLRLPVTQSTIFLSKFAALMLWNYVSSFLLILPVNLIFYFVLKPGYEFFTNTLLVLLLLPMASFLIATILLVPYIKLISFLSHRYLITFILLSGMLIGAFLAYSELLSILQGLFETGSIKFLFSQSFVDFLQNLEKYTYPANALASIALGYNLDQSLKIAGGVAVIALVVVLLVTKRLYKITLFKNENRKIKKGSKRVSSLKPTASLMKKEFISVFREPKNLFSYFAIAIAMPFMVYCCYTLFETLIFNAIGLEFDLALALIVVLVFSILTNTFCATNISRDGVAALKSKMFPVKPSRILLSKVLFCDIVSSLSVIASAVILCILADLSVINTILTAIIGLLFSLSQIFIATRMDLNHAKLTAGPTEIAKSSNRTIAKTITIGLVFAIIIGFLSLFISVFAGVEADFLKNIKIRESYSYLVPLLIAVLYLATGVLYYSIKIDDAFDKLVR